MPRFHSCNVKMFLLNEARPPLKGGTEEPCHLGKKASSHGREPERLQGVRAAGAAGGCGRGGLRSGSNPKAPHRA